MPNAQLLIKKAARQVWRLEPLLLGLMLIAFWIPSPARDRWLWLVFLLPPVWAARWLDRRRLWPDTPLQWALAVFLALGVANVWLAPYTRGLMMLGRPLLGFALYFYMVERVERSRRLDGVLLATTALALLLGAAALLTTQWNEKSSQLAVIVDALPNFTGLPLLEGGFNANEIAGAVSYLLPVMAALAAYRWTAGRARAGVTLAFVLLFAALALGQSRLAILGVIVGLAFVARLVVARGRWRHLALAGLIVFGLFEALLILNVFDTGQQPKMRARDEASFSDRVNIWRSGLDMLRDYPLTGVGMSFFRYNPVRQRYPVPKYENRVLPHAHNELIQIGADLGLPGMAVFAACYGLAGFMLLAACRRGQPETKALAVGVAAGLLAHGVYGLGDAVPLWDRLAFSFWWTLALAGAAWVKSQGLTHENNDLAAC